MLQYKDKRRRDGWLAMDMGLLPPDFDDIEDVERQLVQLVQDRRTVATGAFEPPALAVTASVDMGSNILLIRHRRWAQETRRKQHWVSYWAGRERYEKIRAGDSHITPRGWDVPPPTPARKKEIKMWRAAREISDGSLGSAAMIYEGMMDAHK